jgi:Ca2+-binding EF-hand superfamily protein
MNSLSNLGRLVVAGSFLLGSSLFAQDRPADGEDGAGKRPRPCKEEMLKKFDKDGDGKLNKEEHMALREAMPKRRGGKGRPSKEEILKKFDADGDGKLNEEERAAAREARKKHFEEEALKRFDKDGDGELSEEERAAAREAAKKRRGGREGEKGGRRPSFDDLPDKVKAKLIEKFDADGDGTLNDEEKAKAREERKKRHGAHKGGRKGGRPGGDAAGDTL